MVEKGRVTASRIRIEEFSLERCGEYSLPDSPG
jgi:hypothetical protein